jgi:hypothetical protein
MPPEAWASIIWSSMTNASDNDVCVKKIRGEAMNEEVKEAKSCNYENKDEFLKKIKRLTKPSIELLELIGKHEKRINNPDNSRKILVTK